MPRRARIALWGAAAGIVLIAVTWYVTHYVGFVKRADVSILRGFVQLDRPRVDTLTNFIAGLCDPNRYVFLAAIPILVALLRGRPRVAVTVGFVILAANETTQLLKPLLVAPRDYVYWQPITPASWPSGHATASMTLALCMVIAAPARRRPVVAAAMAAFAIAVSYSFLELGWHYPSDVFGGFLVAATWTLLAVAGLSVYEARRAGAVPDEARAARAGFSVREALAPVGALVAMAALLGALILIVRPHPVIAYARDHETFVVGAALIGILGLMLASGLTLMLRRG